MVQTFDDMLDCESTRLGRFRVWTRTLLDLPYSAVKEHITNGKEFKMTRNFKLLITASISAILIVGLSSFWFGVLHARRNVAIQQVSVAQLGDAMQQDDFYSTYGDGALIFKAKASAIKQDSQVTLVTFATNRPFSATCQFPTNIRIKAGQMISVAAPGGSAVRESTGVLFHNCVEN